MKTILLIIFGALLGIAALPYILFRKAEMPEGTNLKSAPLVFDQAEILIDRTRYDEVADAYIREHMIFDTVLREINAAETFVLVDFFLWNPWKGGLGGGDDFRRLSQELAEALIAKRIQNPNMPILVITDPINRIYGDQAPEFFDRLASYEIPVVFTDLDRLPDSNRIYAPQARFWGSFFGGSSEGEDAKRRMPNPFDAEGEKLTLGQFTRLLYFKANHRKVLVTGRNGEDIRLVIGSLNPADGSANHSNMGTLVQGPVAAFAARSELAVAGWSSENLENVHGGRAVAVVEAMLAIEQVLPPMSALALASEGQASVTYVSEGAIRSEILMQLERATEGARVDIALFYFSDRKIVDALESAMGRGVQVRLLLDANRDAFGREKNGIPNRIVAAELMDAVDPGMIEVRWAATNGEQFHSKVMRIRGKGQDILLLGSANWTRRNIGNLNLEANLIYENSLGLGVVFDHYFEAIWTNADGYYESLPYSDWSESGWSLTWKTWLYRFQEWSGASTF